jgi:hypothetical protein
MASFSRSELKRLLGAGPAIVGLVEGVAEATASILKLVSGWLADRGWNIKKLVVGGYTVSNTFTEGAERALIGDFAPPEQKATVFGIYHLLSGPMALPGALLFGVLWQWVSMSNAFLTAAVLTAISAMTLRMMALRNS